MGRTKKTDTDNQELVIVETIFNWKDIRYGTSEKAKEFYTPGILNKQPHPDMLKEGGVVVKLPLKAKGVIIQVVFDEEYLFDALVNAFVQPLGYLNVLGNFDNKGWSNFTQRLAKYCDETGKRSQEELINQKARELADQFSHKTFEQWKAELLNQKSGEDKATSKPSTAK